jgi:hypothetical protein
VSTTLTAGTRRRPVRVPGLRFDRTIVRCRPSGRGEQDEFRTRGFAQSIRVSIREIRVSQALGSEPEDAVECHLVTSPHACRRVAVRESIRGAVPIPAWRVPRGSMRLWCVSPFLTEWRSSARFPDGSVRRTRSCLRRQDFVLTLFVIGLFQAEILRPASGTFFAVRGVPGTKTTIDRRWQLLTRQEWRSTSRTILSAGRR